jgi:murein DD-endopeptidase MepM/ murein hydrolase activator NlpD
MCHLKKDSIVVAERQKVRQGEIIAKCGNTGNSSEPHLHFQIQKGKNFFTSPGLPVKFDNFSSSLCESYTAVTGLQVYPEEMQNGFITRGFLVKNKSLI